MIKSIQEHADRWALILSFVSAALGTVVIFVFVILEAYLRWTANQTFTLLGDNALAALIVSVFALILGLAYIHKPTKATLK